MNELIFFTDGAYSPLTNKGGWAFYCPNYKLKCCNSISNTTNNRMELEAILNTLKWIYLTKQNRPLIIYSDSLYVINSLNGQYSINKNIDLFNQINLLLTKINKPVTFKHIKAHTKSSSSEAVGNSIADKLAVMASQLL